MEVLILTVAPLVTFFIFFFYGDSLNTSVSIALSSVYFLLILCFSHLLYFDQCYTDIEIIFFHWGFFMLNYNMCLGILAQIIISFSLISHIYLAFEYRDKNKAHNLVALLSLNTSLLLLFLFIDGFALKYLVGFLIQLSFYTTKNYQNIPEFYNFLFEELSSKDSVAALIFSGYMCITIFLILLCA